MYNENSILFELDEDVNEVAESFILAIESQLDDIENDLLFDSAFAMEAGALTIDGGGIRGALNKLTGGFKKRDKGAVSDALETIEDEIETFKDEVSEAVTEKDKEKLSKKTKIIIGALAAALTAAGAVGIVKNKDNIKKSIETLTNKFKKSKDAPSGTVSSDNVKKDADEAVKIVSDFVDKASANSSDIASRKQEVTRTREDGRNVKETILDGKVTRTDYMLTSPITGKTRKATERERTGIDREDSAKSHLAKALDTSKPKDERRKVSSGIGWGNGVKKELSDEALDRLESLQKAIDEIEKKPNKDRDRKTRETLKSFKGQVKAIIEGRSKNRKNYLYESLLDDTFMRRTFDYIKYERYDKLCSALESMLGIDDTMDYLI